MKAIRLLCQFGEPGTWPLWQRAASYEKDEMEQCAKWAEVPSSGNMAAQLDRVT